MSFVQTDNIKEIGTDAAKEQSKDGQKDWSTDGPESSWNMATELLHMEKSNPSALIKSCSLDANETPYHNLHYVRTPNDIFSF